MPLLVLALVATVVLPGLLDGGVVEPQPVVPTLLVAWVPCLLIAAAAFLAEWLAERGLERGRGGALHVLRMRLVTLQWLAVACQMVAVVGFGWLDLVRDWVGNVPVVDEAVALVPPLAAITACWWATSPMESLLRGHPRTEPLGWRRRGAIVLGQVRNQLALIGAPALLALGVSEAVELVVARLGPEGGLLALLATPTAILLLVVVAPTLMVRVLDTTSLEPGPLRRDLEQILADNRVRLRDIRVWRTGGTLFNGAVMGMLAPVRYLLLTDAVLASIPSEGLRAIVAHEVGHIRRRHLPWLVLVMAGTIGLCSLLAEPPARWIAAQIEPEFPPDPTFDRLAAAVGAPILAAEETRSEDRRAWAEIAAGVLVITSTILAFGWVSRRFERQADAFSAQYLSVVGATAVAGGGPRPTSPEQAVVTPAAVLAMCRALGQVADLNGVSPTAPSWRHGSIQWRQRHLVALVSQPILRLPIDRQVALIKWTGTVALVIVMSVEFVRRTAA